MYETHLLTLIPKTVNGQPLTLDSLEELVKHPKQGQATKYIAYLDKIKEQYGSQPPPRSYWVLMTRDVIPESRNKNYEAQKQLVASYSQKARVPYEIPHLLEAAVSIFMEYLKTGQRLYSDNPWTYTRCQERVFNRPLVVGGFGFVSCGLFVSVIEDHEAGGVGGLRKFNDQDMNQDNQKEVTADMLLKLGSLVTPTNAAPEKISSPSSLEATSLEAILRFKKAAEQGDAQAQNSLGICYSIGQGVTKDEKEAVKWFQKAAKQGYAQAQNSLGICYSIGQGVTKDEKEAVKWFQKAAKQGYAGAQHNLGAYYANGRGVTKDEKEAVKWFQKAAEQGYAGAQCHLGVCYTHGLGVAKDEKEAAKWYQKAAEQGYAQAQNGLGDCYAYGRGVAMDAKEAAKWYQKAAEQGYAQAQSNLGICYANGRGVAKDEKEAVKWFQKAADQGTADARYNLGVCYAYGCGVAKDEKEAATWYQKAAAQGHLKAQEALNNLKTSV